MNYKYTKFKIHIYAVIFSIFNSNLLAEEMIFGEEMLQNGIKVIFEAAPKDTVYPEGYFLKENETDIHIEMLMNWTNESPEGSPSGGFIPYLNVSATIENKKGQSNKVKLTPHLNITDNFHYAQNIKLPGDISDLYSVTIKIDPPKGHELGIHYDWNQNYQFLIKEQSFTYEDLSFEKIAKKSRR